MNKLVDLLQQKGLCCAGPRLRLRWHGVLERLPSVLKHIHSQKRANAGVGHGQMSIYMLYT